MMRTALLMTVCCFAACTDGPEAPNVVTSEVDQPVTLHMGESARIGSPALVVRFVAVVADSRCPTRAECVWAGDGAVAEEITPAGGTARADTLHTLLDPKVAVLDGWTVAFTDLALYPDVPDGIASNEYTATFVARRTP